MVDDFNPDSFLSDEFDPDSFLAEESTKRPEEEAKSPLEAMSIRNPLENAAFPFAGSEAQAAQNAAAIEAGLSALGRSASLGIADRLGAAADVALEKLLPAPGADVDAQLRAQGFQLLEAQPLTYEEALARRKELAKQQEEQFPKATMAGEIAGYVVPGVGAEKIAASLLTKAAPRVAALARLAPKTAKEMGVAKTALAARMAQGGLAGGIFGTGAPLIEGQPTEEIEKQAKLGTAVGAAIPVVGTVLRSIPKALQKTAEFLGGGSVEAQTKYFLDKNFIKNAPSLEAIKASVDDIVGKIRADLDSAVLTESEAKAAFDTLEKDAISAARENVALARISKGQEKADAAAMLREAGREFKRALQVKKEQLSAVQPPKTLIDRVHASLDKVQEIVSAESQKAEDILANSTAKISRADILDPIENQIAELMRSASPQKRAAADALQKWHDNILEVLPTDVPVKQLKPLLEDLGQSTKWRLGAGEFDDIKNAQLKTFRRAIDVPLKDLVPEYRAQMEKISDLMMALDESASKFGTTEKAAQRIPRLSDVGLTDARDALKKIESAVGENFFDDIQKHLDTVALRKSKVALDQLGKQLPEAQELEKAQAALDALRKQPSPRLSPEDVAKVKADVRARPEAAALKQAEEQAAKAREVAEQFSYISPATSQGRITGALKDTNIEAKKVLGELSEFSGKPIMEDIQQLKLAAELDPSLLASEPFEIGTGGKISNIIRTLKQVAPFVTRKGVDVARTISESPVGASMRAAGKAAPQAAKTASAMSMPEVAAMRSMASDQAKQSSEKSKGYRYDLSDTEIDQLSEAMPDDGSQGAIAYRNIMRSMKERDMKGRAALLFSLMQNKDYRPIVKKKLDEMQGIKDGQAE